MSEQVAANAPLGVAHEKQEFRALPQGNPAAPCLSPRGLAALGGLTRLERVLVLRQWERAERASWISSANGRPEASRGRLREIADAIASLERHTDLDTSEIRGKTVSDRHGSPPQGTPLPGRTSWDVEERSPRESPVLWSLVLLNAAAVGMLIPLEAAWRDIAVGVLSLSLAALLIVVVRHRR